MQRPIVVRASRCLSLGLSVSNVEVYPNTLHAYKCNTCATRCLQMKQRAHQTSLLLHFNDSIEQPMRAQTFAHLGALLPRSLRIMHLKRPLFVSESLNRNDWRSALQHKSFSARQWSYASRCVHWFTEPQKTFRLARKKGRARQGI